jgi:hypothetical protein
VLDYRVTYDQARGDGVFSSLAVNVTATSYTATNLAAGSTYAFKVEARNSYGYSAPSAAAPILCATVPSIPVAPTTLVIADQLEISWAPAPSPNGTPITAYVVTIKQADGTFTAQASHCNGSQPSIVSSTRCTVPLSVLTAAPYNLTLGQTIQAQVLAQNNYGPSSVSAVGGAAVIVLVPEAPVSLANNPAITMGTSIGLTWVPGASNGGTPVIDY